jgi:hypothetical protein
MLLVIRDVVKHPDGQFDSLQVSPQSETGGGDRPVEAQRHLEIRCMRNPLQL